ncbi:class I SAM-dependent methyltransferase [Clostridium botulinum]|uniref:class I SAM-dependent methyltransferase n=1 Tax=Clostridium botulinum TaxID=1491 RepID=UPI00248F6E62|nr:class I SAM-dependent methyltransferase [Clostridium botulinum]BDB02215.1 polyketide methyltransferase [Clostridium botulinum]
MNNKVKVELNNIQSTLLIPLWSRAKETEISNPIINDQIAYQLVKKLDYDFSVIEKNSTLLKRLMFVVRAKTFDDAIKNFISKYPNSSIVNLGAGLDTTFFRVDNENLNWYNIDLPDVIELRKKLLPESDREKCIAKSFLDISWFNDIKKDYDNVFFLAGGLFAYYDEENIKIFFNNLAKDFPNSEIIFDAPSSKSNNNRTNRAIKKYNLGNIELKLAIKNLKTLQEFSPYIEVNDYFGFFEKIKRKKEWGIINNIQMTLNDLLHISNFYHIRFKN